jgi:hypothetical protein
MMNRTAMKLSAWSGIAFIILIAIGFWGLADFIPPPSPHDSAAQIAHFFREHKTGIRFGMIISMMASGLLGPFVAVITVQMRRIEGRHSVLAYTWLALGAIFGLEFIYLIFFWQTASFRPDRAATIIQSLNDMAWIPFVGLSSTIILMPAVFGIVILNDKRPTPVFPRWFGYFNLWAATMFAPGSFNVFFHTGPLAWNGLFAFYIPVGIFAIWCVVVSLQVVSAVKLQIAEEEAAPAMSEGIAAGSNGHAEISPAVAAELAALREELARVSARIRD